MSSKPLPDYRLDPILLADASEAQKRSADILVELIKVRWGQFNGRRDYEFKVTLSFWTALALAVAGAATLQQKPEFHWSFLTVVWISSILLHWHWCFSIRAISNIDRDCAYHWENVLASTVSNGLPDRIWNQIEDWRHNPVNKLGDPWWKRRANWIHRQSKRNWSHVFQIGVTALLATALVIILWQNEPKKSEVEALQKQWFEADIQRIRQETPPHLPGN